MHTPPHDLLSSGQGGRRAKEMVPVRDLTPPRVPRPCPLTRCR